MVSKLGDRSADTTARWRSAAFHESLLSPPAPPFIVGSRPSPHRRSTLEIGRCRHNSPHQLSPLRHTWRDIDIDRPIIRVQPLLSTAASLGSIFRDFQYATTSNVLQHRLPAASAAISRTPRPSRKHEPTAAAPRRVKGRVVRASPHQARLEPSGNTARHRINPGVNHSTSLLLVRGIKNRRPQDRHRPHLPSGGKRTTSPRRRAPPASSPSRMLSFFSASTIEGTYPSRQPVDDGKRGINPPPREASYRQRRGIGHQHPDAACAW